MDRRVKKVKIVTEPRSLFKKCFKNPIFSLVPYEIWRDLIVSKADAKTVTILCRTCDAFKELVDDLGKRNFNLALMFRKEGQILLAKKYLLKCAENGNSLAMFHVGYSHYDYGWGFKLNKQNAWFLKSAKAGYGPGMAYVSFSFREGLGVGKSDKLSFEWGKKALSTSNPFALGLCHYFGLGTSDDSDRAFSCFQEAAKEGDEFGECMLAHCYVYGCGAEKNVERVFYWNLRAAEKGLCSSQWSVGSDLIHGKGCEEDMQQGIIWMKKAAKQGNMISYNSLISMGILKAE